MSTLTKASEQWSKRPQDERYKSLEDLHTACSYQREHSKQAMVNMADLRVQANDGELVLNGRSGVPARYTHWSFGQLCQRVKAPACYLRELGPTLAAQCLNHGLAHGAVEEREAKLLIQENGGLTLRAITSNRYTRIWNSDVTSRLIRLAAESNQGAWQPAPAAFDGSRGLYASDHDMFAFLVDNDRRIFEKLPGGGLSRGFFVWNSEVGAATFGVMTFLYEYVCGNHLVWGASGVHEIRVRHIGDADDRAFRGLAFELHRYAATSAAEQEAKIEATMKLELGATKDEVLDKIFGLKLVGLTQSRVREAYDTAENFSDRYGSPRMAWGFANGLTQVSQTIPYTDERVKVDRAAGKILEMAF